MHARRALLYVPGDDRHKAEKAISLDVDCICLDLEDGVAANRKDVARTEVANSLNSLDFHGSERLVRLNSVSSGLCPLDLAAILAVKPDGLYLPKVNTAVDIRWIDVQIESFEKAERINPGTISLVAGIESALGILSLVEICQASNRLSGLVFGAEDYMADIGGVRTPQGQEMLFARSALVTCAVAFGLQAIDMVCTDINNEERLLEEARSGMALGFTGKQVIHPAQVLPVQKAFTPDPLALEHAQRIVNAYQEHLAIGKGAFVLDGKMVDMPVVKAAERLLARSAALTPKNDGK
jgi:citrate lyase subunit beta-like protein